MFLFSHPPLEDETHLHLGPFPLFKVKNRRAGAQIVAAVLAGDRVYGIRPQLAPFCGFRDGFQSPFADYDLVHSDGVLISKVGMPVS